MFKKLYLLAIFVILTIAALPFSICKEPSGVGTTENTANPWSTDKPAETINEQIQSGGSTTEGTPSEPLDVQSGSQTANIRGKSKVDYGKLYTKEMETGSGAKGKNVKGFYGDDHGGFYMDYADYFEYNGLIGTNVNSIYGSPTEITLGNAEHVEYKGIDLDDVNILYAGDNVLSIATADNIIGQDVELKDVLTTTIEFEGDKLTELQSMSKVDDNTFILDTANVILDSGKEVEAKFFSDGSMRIETEDPATISKDEEVVVTLTEKIDPGRKILNDSNRSTTLQSVGNSVVEIDPVLGIIAVHLAPTSRYISYATTGSQPFSLFSEKEFDFYLKKHPDQAVNVSSCTGCGMIDYLDNAVYLNGVVEYERLGTFGFVDIVESKAGDNRIELELDQNMQQIKNVKFTGSLAHFYSGPFEVRIKDKFYYNYHEYEGVPYVIEAIEPNIIINETEGLLYI